MSLYRNYNQLGKVAGVRVFGLNALHGEEGHYSQRIKTACLLAAGKPPKAPVLCPRCGQATPFDSRICYKYGVAGAWNMVCRACKQVHFPDQEGPSESDLQRIEAIRDEETEARIARKNKPAQSRAEKKLAKDKKPAKDKKVREPVVAFPGGDGAAPGSPGAGSAPTTQKTSRPSERACDSGSAERPFGIISNASKISNARSDAAFEPHRNNTHGSKSIADHDEVVYPDVRTVVIVVWEKPGTPPIVDRLEIPSGNEIFLYHNPRVRALPPPTEFERWVLEGNVWSPIPWDITPLEVAPDDDVVFVRVMGIPCSGFGEQLHAYQVRRGLALTAAHALGERLYDPPPHHRWILIWMEDFSPPEIFLVDAARFEGSENGDAVGMPWLEKLRDAPFFVLWHDIQTRWLGVLRDRTPNLPEDTPILLLAHPGVAMRLGSGEAIAWLERWRARHQRADVRAKRSGSDAGETVVTKRTRRESPFAAGVDCETPSKPGCHQPYSDDEPEIIAGPPLVERTSRVGMSRAASLAGDSRANPLTLSDDEPEFIQGSSSSPHKGKKRSDAPHRKPEQKPAVLDHKGDVIIDLTEP